MKWLLFLFSTCLAQFVPLSQDSCTAEQYIKTPKGTYVDSLSRCPGVNCAYDQQCHSLKCQQSYWYQNSRCLGAGEERQKCNTTHRY